MSRHSGSTQTVLRVLYIAGYGRSGSTLLSGILGGHPDLVSVGELSFLPEDWSLSGRVCSCGQQYGNCPFWGDLGSQVEPFAKWARRTRTVEKWNRLWPVGRADRKAYARDWRAALEWTARNGNGSTVVDNSKTAWATLRRPLALKALVGAEVLVVHLVRDAYATLESVTRTGSNWELEGRAASRPFPATRAVVGWVVANLAAMLVGRVVGRGRYLRIRYEDLVKDPAAWIDRIGCLAGTQLDELGRRAARGEAFSIGHVAGGNRIRFGAEIRIKTRTPEAGSLRLGHKILCMAGTGWLRRLYGYGPLP